MNRISAATMTSALACSMAWAATQPVPVDDAPETQPAEVQPEQAATDETQIWSGIISLPDQDTPCTITLIPGDGPDDWVGTIDIPSQGVLGLPLAEIQVSPAQIGFRIVIPNVPVNAHPIMTLGINSFGEATGQMSQVGQTFSMTATRTSIAEIEAVKAARRPQHPQLPLGYPSEEVTVEVVDDDDEVTHTLAGTLTLPNADEFGDGPYPAAVLITGSGQQDRDQTIFEHKPFLVIADHLAKAGIAVLRCDDRGVGGSTGEVKDATTLDFATDIGACVSFLIDRDDIAAGSIGLIGHSEGGLIASIVAAGDDRVAFVVMLAGPGVPGLELLIEQNKALRAAVGVPQQQIEDIAVVQARVFQAARDGVDAEAMREDVRAFVAMDFPPNADPRTVDAATDQGLKQITSAWFREFFRIDPAEYLSQIKVPVLALAGELDLQVLPEQNVMPMIEALAEVEDATVEVLDGLNHLFQPAVSGHMREYAQITTTFDPEALDKISSWITDRFIDSD